MTVTRNVTYTIHCDGGIDRRFYCEDQHRNTAAISVKAGSRREAQNSKAFKGWHVTQSTGYAQCPKCLWQNEKEQPGDAETRLRR